MKTCIGIFVAMLAVAVPVRAQGACGPGGWWPSCALDAAGFRGAPPKGVVRQWLFVNRSGPPSVPHRGVLLRESADSVHGWVFATWPASHASHDLATRQCGTRWSNEAGMLCLIRGAAVPDWRMIRDSLVALGLRRVPVEPADYGADCGDKRPDPLPPLPLADGEVARPPVKVWELTPEQRAQLLGPSDGIICSVVFDGRHVEVEAWDAGVHWRYLIRTPQKGVDDRVRRDQALVDLVFGLVRGGGGR